MKHTTMQLYVDVEREAFDIIVTRQIIDGVERLPRRHEYRDVTLASVGRFYGLSGGMRTAYSTKPDREE